MNYAKIFILFLIIFLRYNPDISAQYMIDRSVFGNGFPADSSNNILNGTLGQSIIGTFSDEENICLSGFWSYFVAEKDTVPVFVKENNSPKEFKIIGNYPNPFNPSTTISFELPQQQKVKVVIYSLTGQVLKILLNETLQEGIHSIKWKPEGLSSGSYIFSVEAGTKRISGKMLLLK